MLPLEQLVVLNTMADDVEPFLVILNEVNWEPSFLPQQLSQEELAGILHSLLQSGDVYAMREHNWQLRNVECPTSITLESIFDQTLWFGMTPQGRAKWDQWDPKPLEH